MAKAEAEFEQRSAVIAEEERVAEASRKSREEEAERIRRAAADLAARERALTEAQDELARRIAPPTVPTGFAAGLEALASASHGAAPAASKADPPRSTGEV